MELNKANPLENFFSRMNWVPPVIDFSSSILVVRDGHLFVGGREVYACSRDSPTIVDKSPAKLD